MIRVQHEDFDQNTEYRALLQKGESGAAVTFVGLVREFQDEEKMLLQHYPGMTEKVLEKIVETAHKRWDLQQVNLIHRIGSLRSGDQIVFVGVSSKHRAEAFSACQYIMDILKTQAPFWKKEGNTWVDAKSSDEDAATQWLEK